MKKSLICALALSSVFSASAQFGKLKLNTKKLTEAAVNVVQAVTLSDDDVIILCQQYIASSDSINPICKTTDKDKTSKAYADRLAKLMKGHTAVNGVPLEAKVYNVKEANAFASANGSVRVYAGLMDLLTDDELVGVIGHEIGHVANSDSKDAMKRAYMTTAAKGAVGSTGNKTITSLSESQASELAIAYSTAQYSQKQETEADDYGYEFLKSSKKDPKAMASALRKIAALQAASAEDPLSSKINQLFSSHPDSEARAARLDQK